MNEFLELLYVTGILEEESIDTSNNDYIQKGIRIQTLAREKQLRLCKESKDRTVRFFDLDIKTLNYNNEIAIKQVKSAIKRKIRKLCSQITSDSNSENLIISHITNLTVNLNDITVRLLKDNTDSLPAIVSGADRILIVKIYEEEYYIPLNPQKSFRNCTYCYKSDPSICVNMFHIEDIYLYLYVVDKLNILIQPHGEVQDSTQSQFNLSYLNDKEVFLKRWLQKNIPKWAFESLYPYICKYKSDYKNISEIFSQVKDEVLLEWADRYNHIIDYIYANKKINSNIFLPYLYSNKYIDCISFGIYVLTYLFKNTQEFYENHKQYKKCRHTATVYQTKKNIPKKIIREMRSSPLNQYFGYVEFDESVDLESIRAITKEFLLLNKNIFSDMKYPDKTIRFRKLGRHKAGGLYFKYLGTLAVDIRCPDSMIHEHFHLIDDLMGDLSSQISFIDIADRYQSVLIKTIENDESNGIIHFSKTGKYNLKYYLKKCEIFARCGEIYLFRIKKVNSSLLKQDSKQSFAYPNDSILNKMIEDYYSKLLTKIKNMQKVKKEDESEKHICVADK